jgi:hypothetical protein
MLLHLLGTEQFRSKRWLVAGEYLRQAVSEAARPQKGQVRENGLDAFLQD